MSVCTMRVPNNFITPLIPELEIFKDKSEYNTLKNHLEKVMDHNRYAITNDISIQFELYYTNWYRETASSSFVFDKLEHPDFQKIVDLGEEVIPFILLQLKKQPSFIYFALHFITGEDPILQKSSGNINLIIQDWMNWGIHKRYING